MEHLTPNKGAILLNMLCMLMEGEIFGKSALQPNYLSTLSYVSKGLYPSHESQGESSYSHELS